MSSSSALVTQLGRGYAAFHWTIKAHLTLLQMISLEAPSAETEIAVSTQKNSPDRLYTGLSWSEGQGKYKLTKVITLTPRFLVRNHLSFPITYREHGVIPRERCVLDPEERGALRSIRSEQDKLITIAHAGLNAKW